MGDPTGDPAVAVYFKVAIDGFDLGAFISCEGLGVEVETQEWQEGGNNSFVWKFPGRLKYSNVKLTRPLSPETARVAEWFARMGREVRRTTAAIVALTPRNEPVATWTLEGVIPVRWQGPSFSAESPKVATETLELSHHGFRVA